MSGLNNRQVQKMLQKISPQQIQMIKLLELPAMQLEQKIKQEIEDNPVLDEQMRAEDDEENPSKDISVDEYLKEDDTPSYKYQTHNYSKDDDVQRQIHLSGGVSFHEYLVEQLGFKSLSSRDMMLAEYIVGSLDEDGYLRRGLDSVADDIAFSLSIETSEQELERLLRIIQELEPTGVGARTLQECLLLQLEASDRRDRIYNIAKRVLTNHFDEFKKKHYPKLQDKLAIDEDTFRDVIEEILHLYPKPGNLYSEGSGDTMPYIVPDFLLDYQNGKFELSLNSSSIPDLKVNKRYVEMIRSMASSEGKVSDSNRDALQFVKNKIDSAKWFISAIKQRHDTLTHTMQAILDYQTVYFMDGNRSALKPMILKDIADATGLDVSTISRVVNSKYIQTHFGIIQLKQLFSEAMQTDSGQEVSSYQIKNILSECIESEDKKSPLTDEVLMEILNSKGYQIARRTVAKYREMLDIPVARLRKKL
ncbi:MAG: RNA polymerase factor sigma-54 [Rikenellaceae bacterium]